MIFRVSPTDIHQYLFQDHWQIRKRNANVSFAFNLEDVHVVLSDRVVCHCGKWHLLLWFAFYVLLVSAHLKNQTWPGILQVPYSENGHSTFLVFSNQQSPSTLDCCDEGRKEDPLQQDGLKINILRVPRFPEFLYDGLYLSLNTSTFAVHDPQQADHNK